MFVVAPGNKTTAEQDLTMVSQWIAESLGNIGAGAKPLLVMAGLSGANRQKRN